MQLSLEMSARTPAPASLEAILADLNEEQLQAVTHGEGPLLIVAGAGTGKTAVITRRIAWLIATKRARPEEILALTFTEKAATEMETRVDQLVPYGFIGATIATFHAFCDRLVREHAIELKLTSRLRVESRAEILVFLRERLFELGLERYLPLGQPDRHLQALVTLFDRARDEDISPERYLAFAQELDAASGDDPERRDRAASQLELAGAYGNYQRLLLENGRIDFGSQISLALRLLRERPWLRRQIQDAYRYILVDEFQDTNHVQFELVKLLAGEQRNLVVVGDDDQSIYRFRGAKVENLLDFLRSFPGARVQLLRRNYRSGQSILDQAHRMIRHNDPERFEAKDPARYDKRLIADRESPGAVELRVLQSASDEADAVAGEIVEQIESGERAARDIAVLARTHNQLDAFALALRARGVRFIRSNTAGLYARPEVRLCLNMLRLVDDPDDGGVAYSVLGDPLFGADPVDLARMSAAAGRRNRGLLRTAAHWADGGGEGLSDNSIDAVRRLVDLHRRLAEMAPRRPTSEILYEFVRESGLLGQLHADEGPDATERAQNLSKLFGIVTRVGPLLKLDRVPQFIRHLDLLIEAGDDPSAAQIESDEDAVRLLTAHNAKGLEFPVVYLVQLVELRFPLDLRQDPIPFPAELRTSGGNERADHDREERRLFYVAMTRARDRLVLTHALDYGGKSVRKTSRFVVEALGLPGPVKARKGVSALEDIARYAPAAQTPAPEMAPIPADKPLRISHGQIDDVLTCPLKYRYAHVVKVPLASDPVAMYGIAVHNAVRLFEQHRLRGIPIDPDAVIAEFERSWSSEGFYSREHEERRLEEGRQALRRFIAREEASGRIPLAIESEFKFIAGNDVVVGRWDRVDESPDGVVLVDYKTSEIEDPERADESAHRSLRESQLGLYALAYRETRRVTPTRVELDFVGTGVVGRATVRPENLERAAQRLREAAARIRSAQFPADPDPRKCGNCPYARFCPHSMARPA